MRARTAALAMLFSALCRPGVAQVASQLPFPLVELLPRTIAATGGLLRWRGLRDFSLLVTRRQLQPNGSVRAREDLEIHIQNVPHVNLLLVRKTRSSTIHEGWHRDWAWMVEDGRRVHDRIRLEAARRELLESLFLERLPFDLPDEVRGSLVYEGDYLMDGRRVHRLRFRSGEFPGGEVRVFIDSENDELHAVGWHSPDGHWTEMVFLLRYEEHGIRTPWLRELRVDGVVTRRDQVRTLRTNQWLSPDVFKAESWLERPSPHRSRPAGQ